MGRLGSAGSLGSAHHAHHVHGGGSTTPCPVRPVVAAAAGCSFTASSCLADVQQGAGPRPAIHGAAVTRGASLQTCHGARSAGLGLWQGREVGCHQGALLVGGVAAGRAAPLLQWTLQGSWAPQVYYPWECGVGWRTPQGCKLCADALGPHYVVVPALGSLSIRHCDVRVVWPGWPHHAP